MTESSLKDRINEAMKSAMRARDKDRLGTVRLIQAEIKRIEVDERVEVDNERLIAILDKMVKQRRDSIRQYRDAGRDDLARKEEAEVAVIQEFLPAPLSPEELDTLVADAVAITGAASMQDMGKVMGVLKPKVQGRADMGEVSKAVKAKLG
jgi:hypothetical protein